MIFKLKRPGRSVLAGVTVLALSATGIIQAAGPAAAASFGTVSPPLSSAVDYITGLPSCSGIGPVGLLPEKAAFLVSDWCNSTTYRYDTTGSAPVLVASLQNGITHGLTRDNGVYYGVASSNQNVLTSGVYSLDPVTLKITGQVIGNPCGGGDIRGLAADSATGDLLLTGDCGLFHISNPSGTVPFFTQIASGNFDGITIDQTTDHAWIADNGNGKVIEFDLGTNTELRSFSGFNGPDGVAIAASSAGPDVAGDVFVNGNDGTITRIDLPSGTESVVASGGSRGDFVAVGPDGYLYATQSSLVEQVQPAIFTPTVPTGSPGLDYVALGDSYASGEGATEDQFYPSTTFPDPAATGTTTGCHRSHTSWGEATANALLKAGKITSWRFVACSGAVTDNLYGINGNYAKFGEVEPPQLNAVTKNTIIATLSMGGNDANFSDILSACAEAFVNGWIATNGYGCRNPGRTANQDAAKGLAQIASGIKTPSLGPDATKKLSQVYLDILSKMNPNGRLIVTGYPRLFASSRAGYDFGATCKVGTATRIVGQLPLVFPVFISYADAQWLNGLADKLNAYIQQYVTAANTALINSGQAARVEFVPVSPAFDNHRICSGARWFNGVEFPGPFRGGLMPQPAQVSFHPNKQGQAAYASVVVPVATR